MKTESDTHGGTLSLVVCMLEKYHDVRLSSPWIVIGSRVSEGSGVEGEGEREGWVIEDVESISLDEGGWRLKVVSQYHNIQLFFTENNMSQL